MQLKLFVQVHLGIAALVLTILAEFRSTRIHLQVLLAIVVLDQPVHLCPLRGTPLLAHRGTPRREQHLQLPAMPQTYYLWFVVTAQTTRWLLINNGRKIALVLSRPM